MIDTPPKPMAMRGFTLVELAIVMTIVGLLIGGVLKGQSLVENGRITRTIKDFDSLNVAAMAFRDQFSQWPGDMANATQRLPSCDAGNFCENGNSNGKIGWICSANSDQSGARGDGMNYVASCNGTPNEPRTANIETTMFFKHLALAGLITSVTPSADPAVPEWGRTHPAAPLAGGYHMQYTYNQGAGLSNGQWLRLQKGVTGNPWNFGGSGPMAVTPAQAWKIDSKIDDGRPQSGFVTAISQNSGAGNGRPGCGDATVANVTDYNTQITDSVCVVYSRLF